MRCSRCNGYIPEGLRVKECPSCGNEVKEEALIESIKIIEENSILDDKITKIPLIEKSVLTKEQEEILEEKLEKGLKKILIGSLILLFIITASFIIPARLIPSRGSYIDIGNDTLADVMGVFPTLIYVAIMALVLFSAIIKHSKFFKIKKDLKMRNVTSFEAKVTHIRELAGDDEKEYDVYVETNEAGIQKLNYLISEFPDLNIGDNIKITIANVSQVVLSTQNTQKTNEKSIIRNYSRK